MTTISIFFKCSSNKSLRVEQWGVFGVVGGGKIVGVDGNGCHGGNAPSVAYFCFCFCGCLEAFFFVNGCVCVCVYASVPLCAAFPAFLLFYFL